MKQFFQQTFASCLGTLAGLIVFLGLGAGGLAVLFFSLLGSEDSEVVKDKSVLIFNLSTNISDRPPSSSLTSVLGSQSAETVTLRQVIGAIEKASEDPKIVGLLLYGRSTTGSYGYATLAEVRGALEKFRASGKKIIAYDVDWTKKEYYLASIADQILLNPIGSMEMNGLSSQQMFFSQALDKYGIGVQVVKVGSFKGAIEPYTRQELSPENRLQIQELLDNIWSNYKSVIGKSRQLTPQQIQTVADNQGIFSASSAKQSGLVDQVVYFDQVISEMRKLTGQKEADQPAENNFQSFRQVSLEKYADSVETGDNTHKIAILYAEGSIVDGQGETGEIGSDRYAKELRKLQQDEDVKAVVLRINSPGGSATASEVILREVKRLSEKKPVIVSMGDFAASGGYWIALGGQRIFAENNTITGSIGVFGLLFNLQKIAKNNGVSWDTVKTAKLADIFTNSRPKNERELKLYQKSVNQFYNLFIEKVAKARKLSPDKVRSIAQGRVWSGKEALPIGLIDEIGGLESAVEYAVKVAKLDDDWSIVEYPRSQTWEEEILSQLFQTYLTPLSETNDPVRQEWRKLQKELTQLQNFNDPRGVYARLGLNLDIR